jgi:hypothetical protein
MANYIGQLKELGLKIFETYLVDRFDLCGYKFIKSREFAFKKEIDDFIIELLFYKDFYIYQQGSIEKYDCPVIEMSGRYSIQSKNFNKWSKKTLNNNPNCNDLLRKNFGAFQFMVDVIEPQFILEEWKMKNQDSANLIFERTIELESNFENLKNWNSILEIKEKSIKNYDILMFLKRDNEALKLLNYEIDNLENNTSGLDKEYLKKQLLRRIELIKTNYA